MLVSALAMDSSEIITFSSTFCIVAGEIFRVAERVSAGV